LPPFDRIVEEHGPAVLRFCAARLGADRAEDCFQETMIAGLRAYGSQLREPRAIRTYLLSIAARKAIDMGRARAREPQPPDAVDPLGAAYEHEPTDEALWAKVHALPNKQRQAVILRYRGDLIYAEIAEVMQISEAAARRNLFEGLEQLRKET